MLTINNNGIMTPS